MRGKLSRTLKVKESTCILPWPNKIYFLTLTITFMMQCALLFLPRLAFSFLAFQFFQSPLGIFFHSVGKSQKKFHSILRAKSIWRYFLKRVLPDRSILIRQKIVRKCQNKKLHIFAFVKSHGKSFPWSYIIKNRIYVLYTLIVFSV